MTNDDIAFCFVLIGFAFFVAYAAHLDMQLQRATDKCNRMRAVMRRHGINEDVIE